MRVASRAHRAGLATLLLVVALAGCGKLITPYDYLSDAGVMAVYRPFNRTLAELERDPTPSYGPEHAQTYRITRADLQTLRVRAEARLQNDGGIAILDGILAILDNFEHEHERGVLKPALVAIYRNIFAQAFRAAMRAELAKREAIP